MANDKFYPVSVKTVPNGYVLNANGHEYLYFSASDLITGMMYHITSGIDADEYVDHMKKLVTDLDVMRHKVELRCNNKIKKLEHSLKIRDKKIAKLEEMLKDKDE